MRKLTAPQRRALELLDTYSDEPAYLSNVTEHATFSTHVATAVAEPLARLGLAKVSYNARRSGGRIAITDAGHTFLKTNP